jgi:3-hydroxymyristoyl/3-hydroxydecanoyl-(acyl carrier protein) dehydratase
MSTDHSELHGSFVVAADHPCLAGHFPGDPIVPAVLLLDLSCALLEQLRPELGPLREVRSVKFMQPVRPGEAVETVFTPGAAPGTLRFTCSTAAGVAVQGQMLFGSAP